MTCFLADLLPMESEELIKKLLEKQNEENRRDQNKFKMERQQKLGESNF
jgi:hypothetical protein